MTAVLPPTGHTKARLIDDPCDGETIKAVVVLDGPCPEEDLLAYCRERLAAFKIPRLVEFRDALPRSPLAAGREGVAQRGEGVLTADGGVFRSLGSRQVESVESRWPCEGEVQLVVVHYVKNEHVVALTAEQLQAA